MHLHPYLTESLVLLAVAFPLMLVLPSRIRPLACLSGAMAAPFAILSLVHVPDFWQPVYLWPIFPAPEDAIWCAAMGMIVGTFALFPVRHRIQWQWSWRQSFLRYVVLAGLGLLLHWPLCLLLPGPPGTMPATIFSMLALGIITATMHPPARHFVGWPALAYSLFHWADVHAFFLIWPQTRGYWNPPAQLPFSFLGVPAYEVFWAAAFALAWPCLIAFIGNVHITRPRAPADPTGP